MSAGINQTLESMKGAAIILLSQGDRFVGEHTPDVDIHPLALLNLLDDYEATLKKLGEQPDDA